jgi:hypothetical protein
MNGSEQRKWHVTKDSSPKWMPSVLRTAPLREREEQRCILAEQQPPEH